MPVVDLDADLIPGTSAAGWRIGVRLTDCHELMRGATEVEYRPGFKLVEAIVRNAAVLVVRNTFPLGSGNMAVYVGAELVGLNFNAQGELFEVSVEEGYRGRAFGRVGIGTPAGEVRSLFPLFFDKGDEMFYPGRPRHLLRGSATFLRFIPSTFTALVAGFPGTTAAVTTW